VKVRVPTPKASIAFTPDESNKLYAPSASRNAGVLCDVVALVAPKNGDALEIASGTGQHIVAFAAAIPAVQWHPSEVEATRLRSIEAYVHDSELSNISAPITLNATQVGWGETIAPKGLIILANLLHLISEIEAATVLQEGARALAPSGHFCIYGPFKRDGEFTSDGDERFDFDIRAADSEVGYKDDAWIKRTAQNAGLDFMDAHEMPANNLALIFRKS
jgi:SAM-dependent methyltransferase